MRTRAESPEGKLMTFQEIPYMDKCIHTVKMNTNLINKIEATDYKQYY